MALMCFLIVCFFCDALRLYACQNCHKKFVINKLQLLHLRDSNQTFRISKVNSEIRCSVRPKFAYTISWQFPCGAVSYHAISAPLHTHTLTHAHTCSPLGK